MAEQLTPIDTDDLELAARGLLRWNARRGRLTKMLRGYDIAIDPKNNPHKYKGGWAMGDPRAFPSIFMSLLVREANDRFTDVAAQSLGIKVLAPDERLPSDQAISGHPYDPLVRFPNGLILRSVAAAEYVLETQTGIRQDTLQTNSI